MSNTQVSSDARALLSQTLVWDNHACMPLRHGDDEFLPQLQRCREAGCDVVSLNIGFGFKTLDEHLRSVALFRQWVSQRPEHYRLATSLTDIDHARESGQLAIVFDVEGMALLDEGDYGLVSLLRELGVIWMLVAYNNNNAAGGGCADEDPGLTAHGRAILKEMKRVGMIACCSHTGHRTAMDVMEAADNPVVFSHSNASAVHSHFRNIPDELILACAETGGVVGINGIGEFLGEGADEAELLLRHIDHVVNLVGPEHVGLGLDYVFDQQELLDYLKAHPELFGVDPAPNIRMAGPEVLPELVTKMLQCGYERDLIEMILGGNWRRVAQQVWIDG
ncbi:MAG: membrane dipeptidase [Pseudomonadota bacterium]